MLSGPTDYAGIKGSGYPLGNVSVRCHYPPNPSILERGVI